MLGIVAILVFIAHIGSAQTAEEIPLGKIGYAKMSSTHKRFQANLAIDGDINSYAHTEDKAALKPWWEVDLGDTYIYTITRVEIRNRPGFLYRLGNIVVTLDKIPCNNIRFSANELIVNIECNYKVSGRYLRITLKDAPFRGILTLNEVRAWGTKEKRPSSLAEINFQCFETAMSSVDSNSASIYAVDGDISTFASTIVGQSSYPWWEVEMGARYTVTSVNIRSNAGFLETFRKIRVTVDDRPCNRKAGVIDGNVVNNIQNVWIYCPTQPYGSRLRIELIDVNYNEALTLAEVKAYGHSRGSRGKLSNPWGDTLSPNSF